MQPFFFLLEKNNIIFLRSIMMTCHPAMVANCSRLRWCHHGQQSHCGLVMRHSYGPLIRVPYGLFGLWLDRIQRMEWAIDIFKLPDFAYIPYEKITSSLLKVQYVWSFLSTNRKSPPSTLNCWWISTKLVYRHLTNAHGYLQAQIKCRVKFSFLPGGLIWNIFFVPVYKEGETGSFKPD